MDAVLVQAADQMMAITNGLYRARAMSRAATHLLFASLLAGAATSVVAATSPEDALSHAADGSANPAVQRWVIRAFANDEPEQGGCPPRWWCASAPGARYGVGRRLHWYYVEGFQRCRQRRSQTRPAGASLDAIAVSIEERDVLAAGCTPITDAQALNGMRTRRALRDNEVICHEPHRAPSSGGAR